MDTAKVFSAPEIFLGSVIWYLLLQFAYAFQYVLICFWFTEIPTPFAKARALTE